MQKYSKAIAALVTAATSFLVIHFGLEVDSAALEGALLVLLTTAGVYAAPANRGA